MYANHRFYSCASECTWLAHQQALTFDKVGSASPREAISGLLSSREKVSGDWRKWAGNCPRGERAEGVRIFRGIWRYYHLPGSWATHGALSALLESWKESQSRFYDQRWRCLLLKRLATIASTFCRLLRWNVNLATPCWGEFEYWSNRGAKILHSDSFYASKIDNPLLIFLLLAIALRSPVWRLCRAKITVWFYSGLYRFTILFRNRKAKI